MKNESSDDACRDGNDRAPHPLTGKISKAKYRCTNCHESDVGKGRSHRLTVLR